MRPQTILDDDYHKDCKQQQQKQEDMNPHKPTRRETSYKVPSSPTGGGGTGRAGEQPLPRTPIRRETLYSPVSTAELLSMLVDEETCCLGENGLDPSSSSDIMPVQPYRRISLEEEDHSDDDEEEEDDETPTESSSGSSTPQDDHCPIRPTRHRTSTQASSTALTVPRRAPNNDSSSNSSSGVTAETSPTTTTRRHHSVPTTPVSPRSPSSDSQRLSLSNVRAYNLQRRSDRVRRQQKHTSTTSSSSSTTSSEGSSNRGSNNNNKSRGSSGRTTRISSGRRSRRHSSPKRPTTSTTTGTTIKTFRRGNSAPLLPWMNSHNDLFTIEEVVTTTDFHQSEPSLLLSSSFSSKLQLWNKDDNDKEHDTLMRNYWGNQSDSSIELFQKQEQQPLSPQPRRPRTNTIRRKKSISPHRSVAAKLA